jgi:hypothetical protein
MVVHLLAATLVTLVVLGIAAHWSVDRYLRYGLAAALAAALVASRLAGNDQFVVGYWAIGFAFGGVVHDLLARRRRPV